MSIDFGTYLVGSLFTASVMLLSSQVDNLTLIDCLILLFVVPSGTISLWIYRKTPHDWSDSVFSSLIYGISFGLFCGGIVCISNNDLGAISFIIGTIGILISLIIFISYLKNHYTLSSEKNSHEVKR